MEQKHIILTEIKEQASVAKAMFKREHDKDVLDIVDLINRTLNSDGEIYLVGSGSSYYAAVFASHLFAKNNHFIASAILAGDFDSYIPDLGRRDLVVIYSQSGNNPTILDGLHHIAQRLAKTALITNDVDSPLSNRCDLILPLEIGKEKAVPATKSFFAEILFTSLMSEALKDGSELFSARENLLNEIARITSENYYSKLDGIAKYLAGSDNIYVLGEGIEYANAQEAALKFKECAQLSAEAYIASEFLHGPIAALKKGMPVIMFTDNQSDIAKQVADKIKAAGGAIIAVGEQNLPQSDAFIPLKGFGLFSGLVSIIPLQLLAYKIALEKGLNPDKPPGVEK